MWQKIVGDETHLTIICIEQAEMIGKLTNNVIMFIW